MQDDWTDFIDYRFSDEEGTLVWVTIPRQESGCQMRIVLEEKPQKDDLPGTYTVFEPADILINFRVESNCEGVISTMGKFSPPMVLRARITDKAKQAVPPQGRLQLAFHDGSEWLPFTWEKHLFRLTPKSGIAVIRDWGDPPVAWG